MLDTPKRLASIIPFLRPLLMKMRSASFRSSADYWEQRYRSGGRSGAGSYNRLADFKAIFLNGFVAREGVRQVLELGCGDGAQLTLARYPSYIGIDVAPSAIARCRELFRNDSTKRFYLPRELATDLHADLVLSLDVIYHLVEDDVFEAYMREVFFRARRFVIIYSSNRDAPQVTQHVRHRHFTRWIGNNALSWHLSYKISNLYPYDPRDPEHTSFADFYIFVNERLSQKGHCQEACLKPSAPQTPSRYMHSQVRT